MNATLNEIATFARPPGLYTLRSRARPAAIVRSLEQGGRRCFYLDGGAIGDKAAFLAAAAEAMRFPAYFGHNWDAFEECVNDLSWAPARGYALLYDNSARFARAQPAEWATARAILAAAAERWRATPTPFYALLRPTFHSAAGRSAGPP